MDQELLEEAGCHRYHRTTGCRRTHRDQEVQPWRGKVRYTQSTCTVGTTITSYAGQQQRTAGSGAITGSSQHTCTEGEAGVGHLQAGQEHI